MARRRLAYAKKNAEKQGATLIFVDESGFYLLPLQVRSYAPRGHTPILHCLLSRSHLSVISGITAEGKLLAQMHCSSICSQEAIAFLKYLLRHIPGKVWVLWDGAPIHHSQQVREFLTTAAAQRLKLIRLPAYAPELNPDEGVWSQLKRSLANVCSRTLGDLKVKLKRAIQRLQRRPEVLQGCLKETGLY
jgi:transposase